MTDLVVRVNGIGKSYLIGGKQEQYKTFRESIIRTLQTPLGYRSRKNNNTFWALKDISFEVKRGEVLGIIGRNGAGKSTLLKILSRITEPTIGTIYLKGRVGSLLEVGTGFHPELTGRENIYLSATILGMTRLEVTRKFDEIVAFAGVEQFIDTPVKRYSSGMGLRLGFAVAAHLESEILIIDEVLAVGDAQFQKKCLGKMTEVASEGRTVLFVSHNLEAVLGLCSRAIWLHEGKINGDGQTRSVIEQYSTSVLQTSSSVKLFQRTDRMGGGEVRITDFSIRDENDLSIDQPVTGQPVKFVLNYESFEGAPQDIQCAFIVTDFFLDPKLVLASNMTGDDLTGIQKTGEIVCYIPRWPLRQGGYYLNIRLYSSGSMIDGLNQAVYVETTSGDFYGSGGTLWNENTVLVDFRWTHQAMQIKE